MAEKILLVVLLCIVSSETLTLSSIDATYQKALDAYSGDRWSECIVQFEGALHLYKTYKSVINNCRLNCHSEIYKSQINESLEDLKFYENLFNRKNCLTRCYDDEFQRVRINSDVSNAVLSNIRSRKPYEYLHVCYFNVYALPKAATAAYTFLASNPDDEQMKKNLKYYTEQPEVDINEVVDLESEDFEVLYLLGMKTYREKNWQETIASMEEVLIDYILWENSCRVECESHPQEEGSSEFTMIVSNYIANLLQCKQQCQEKLKALEFKSGIEFLADVLNYLQISYYHLEKYEDAAKAVASYLALDPTDEDMLENKKIYSSLINNEAFVERSAVIYYFKRDTYEKNLMRLNQQGNYNRNEFSL